MVDGRVVALGVEVPAVDMLHMAAHGTDRHLDPRYLLGGRVPGSRPRTRATVRASFMRIEASGGHAVRARHGLAVAGDRPTISAPRSGRRWLASPDDAQS